jgi:hypothetical protein
LAEKSTMLASCPSGKAALTKASSRGQVSTFTDRALGQSAYSRPPRQAKDFSLALAKGDPDEVGVIRGAARQVLEMILPGKDWQRSGRRQDVLRPAVRLFAQ